MGRRRSHKQLRRQQQFVDSASDSIDLSPITYRVYGLNAAKLDRDAIDWLLHGREDPEDAANSEQLVSVATSFRSDGLVDALVFTVRRRQLVLKVAPSGKGLIKGEDRFVVPAVLGRLLRSQDQEDSRPVKLVGFHAALTALHISGATNLDARIVDVSGLAHESLCLDFIGVSQYLLGAEAKKVFDALQPPDFIEDQAEKYSVSTQSSGLDRGIVRSLLTTSICSIAAFHCVHLCKWLPFHEHIVDTKRLPIKDRVIGSEIISAYQGAMTLQPRAHQVGFDSVQSTWRAGTAQADVLCNRFREQPRVNKRQTVYFSFEDGKVLRGKTRSAVGKTSSVAIEGQKISQGRFDKLAAIVVAGRDEPATSVFKAWKFWHNVLSVRNGEVVSGSTRGEAVRLLDPSGLLYPLLRGIQPVSRPISWTYVTSFFNEVPQGRRYPRITNSSLNPSQKKAAKALAAPIRSWQDRIVVIHGPPGTGKTRVVSEFARQWELWARFWPNAEDASSSLASLWCCCQSNAATKNMAEALKGSGVKFKIFVSDHFYYEWHEHMYTSMEHELINTKGLQTRLTSHPHLLDGVRVFLCTIDCLSSRIFGPNQADLFASRPVHCLAIDEASQLVLGAYPHLLERHSGTLGRVCFLGDHQQLGPYAAGTIENVKSVFELPHLRDRAHLLTQSYRLPAQVCQFISREMYAGALTAAPAVEQQSLAECVRLIDVASGRERRDGHSYTNAREVALLCTLVDTQLKGRDWRILTTYNGQRDLLEDALKGRNIEWQDKVFTADAFQGQEAEVIVISLVRDGLPGPRGQAAAGFLSNERRTNVLLTRAKKVTYVFSSKRFLVDEGAVARETLMGRLALEVGDEGWYTELDVWNASPKLQVVRR